MESIKSISLELKELGSNLEAPNYPGPYQVPEGYFEELIPSLMNRIKALDEPDAGREIGMLSPLLAGISREQVYTVPDGYFAGLENSAIDMIRDHPDYLSAEEELGAISPLLSAADKKIPYNVPAGYFESLKLNKEQKEERLPGKVLALKPRNWARYAAAAVITGIICAMTILVLSNSQIDPNKNPERWVKKNVEKKVNEDKLDEFVEMTTEEELPAPVIAEKSQEVAELVKDISAEEIDQFLAETASVDDSNDSEIMLN